RASAGATSTRPSPTPLPTGHGGDGAGGGRVGSDRAGRAHPMTQRRRTTIAAIALGGAALAACRGNTYAPPPPPEVTVAQPIEREVTTYVETTGHTVAIEAVDIRARVQGFLQSVNFTPGTDVKQGDLLFVIEPTLYQARVQQAQADLE